MKKMLITGALAAPLLYLGLTAGASAFGAPAYPQGLDDPPPSEAIVRQVNRGHHYGWTKGRHRGPYHAVPPHGRGPYPR